MSKSKDRSREKPVYLSYLLRLWWEDESEEADAAFPAQVSNGPNREPVWRASVQDPKTGERWGFANLAALFHFLWHETTSKCGSGSISNEAKEGGDGLADELFWRQ